MAIEIVDLPIKNESCSIVVSSGKRSNNELENHHF